MSDDLKHDFGARVLELRTLRGLSQADLAKASKISQPTISDVESGSAGVRLDTAQKLADALGVDLDELMRGLGKRRSRKAG
jgi:transcriptional regulator with XRE-family HTH domain